MNPSVLSREQEESLLPKSHSQGALESALVTIPFVGDYLAGLHQRLTTGMLFPSEAEELARRIDALAELSDEVRREKGLI